MIHPKFNLLPLVAKKQTAFAWGVQTWEEALERWDSNQLIFTIEMGGLGPGYDHAINVMVFELLRHQKVHGCLLEGAAEFPSCWNDTVNKAVEGCSGAQAGAAKSLAAGYILKGYLEVLHDPTLQDRLVQDTKEMQ